MLRPVRETMGIAGGVRNLPSLFTGTLTAMLRNPNDQSVLADAPLRSDALFGKAKAGKARTAGRSIELIIGNGADAPRYLRMPVAAGSLSPAPEPPLASN